MSVQHNMTHLNITDQSAYQEPAGDPHELLVNGMEDVEPEPEAIVGMPAADALTPADRYLELFTDVQMQHIFEDSKTFADCAPKTDPLDILMLYRKQRRVDKAFDLKQFVLQNFFLPPEDDCYHHNDAAKPLCQHIDDLWNILTRQPEKHYHNSSLLPLPRSYIVPGGRFGEMYYWDSYFTMLGLAESGRQDLIQNMAENFAWMIERYGHIPNGNRTYYLSRSQPPVFSLMVELCEQAGLSDGTRYLSYLICEYHYWMDGAVALQPDQAYRHVVRMPDGMVLNRYWDDRDTPRDESWREDMATAQASERPDNEVFRDLRAGAASGWDYSSRWLREPDRLASIRTTQFIPVDLNALLYKLEMMIVRVADQAGEIVTARAWQLKADERQQAMNRWLWDDDSELYRDYDWHLKKPAAFSAAAVVALFTRVASPAQARQLARQIRKHLLAPGGLLTSTLDSGEQWDKPNGWAPIQWMAIKGLEFYGEQALATEIAVRWLKTVDSYYQQEHKMVEKYNIVQEQSIPGSGGEYPLQDGFGWTNGVTRCLMTQYGHLLPAENPPE